MRGNEANNINRDEHEDYDDDDNSTNTTTTTNNNVNNNNNNKITLITIIQKALKHLSCAPLQDGYFPKFTSSESFGSSIRISVVISQ